MDEAAKIQKIVKEMTVAYWPEMETVQNFIANSINLTGVRAEEIKKSLAADVTAEIGHAQQLAQRVHVIGGVVPGSMSFKAIQKSLQPQADRTDVAAVIRGVIDAEDAAIAQYKVIIAECEGFDYPTQDLCITLLADEEEHRREFLGFLTEYEKS